MPRVPVDLARRRVHLVGKAQIDRLSIGRRLLGEELQAERLASIEPIHPEVPDGAAYDMALAQFGPMLGHDGSLPGFQSFMGHDPNHHATVIVVTNLQVGAGDEQPANEIARALLGEL